MRASASSTWPPAISRSPTKTAPSGRCSTARSSTTWSCARRSRRPGHVFRTHSDTETIVHAYEEYGDDFVHASQRPVRHRALGCSRRRRLLLVRDRVGIRPLFVQRDGQRLLFASEVKAILAVSIAAARASICEGLAQVFTFWSTVGERTRVRRRALGSAGPHAERRERSARTLRAVLGLESSGAAATTREPSFDEAAERIARAARPMRCACSCAPTCRWAPISAAVSTPRSSSAMIRAAHRRAAAHVLGVLRRSRSSTRAHTSRPWCDHLGTDHTAVRCSHRDIGDAFARLIAAHRDAHRCAPAPVPLMILSEHVRESGFKVVLTGEGADEVFGGYDLFKEAQIRRFWARQPDSQWRPQLLTRLYPYLKHSPVGSGAYAQSFFGRASSDVGNRRSTRTCQRWATTRRCANFSVGRCARPLVAQVDPEADLADAAAGATSSGWAGLSRDQYVEAQTLLYGYLLSSQGDRVADGEFGRGPRAVPRPSRHRVRQPPAGATTSCAECARRPCCASRSTDLLPPAIVESRQAAVSRAGQPVVLRRRPSRSDLVQDLLSPERLRDAGYFDARGRGPAAATSAAPAAPSASPTTWLSSASCRPCWCTGHSSSAACAAPRTTNAATFAASVSTQGNTDHSCR